MDGISTASVQKAALPPIFILAVTNKFEEVDKAIIRPGRLDLSLHIRLPKLEQRREILFGLLKGIPSNISPEEMQDLARNLDGYSGGDIDNLIREAVLQCLRESIDSAERTRDDDEEMEDAEQGESSEDLNSNLNASLVNLSSPNAHIKRSRINRTESYINSHSPSKRLYTQTSTDSISLDQDFPPNLACLQHTARTEPLKFSTTFAFNQTSINNSPVPETHKTSESEFTITSNQPTTVSERNQLPPSTFEKCLSKLDDLMERFDILGEEKERPIHILKKYLNALVVYEEVDDLRPDVWCASAIWIATKSNEEDEDGMDVTLSKLAKVVKKSCKVDEIAHAEILLKFVNTIKDVLNRLHFDFQDLRYSKVSGIIKRNEDFLHVSYLLFTLAKDLFEKLISNPSDIMEEYFRYAWLLTTFGMDFYGMDWMRTEAKTLCMICVVFVASQINRHRARATQLCPQFSGISLSPELDDWLLQMEETRIFICNRYNISRSEYHECENNQIGQIIQTLTEQKIFMYRGTYELPLTGWVCYDGAFAMDPTGLFEKNLMDLKRECDVVVFNQNSEVDVTAFLPPSRILQEGGTKRQVRTPMVMSVVRTAPSRNLAASLLKTSNFSRTMTATPLTARHRGNMVPNTHPNSEATAITQNILSNLVEDSPQDSGFICNYVSFGKSGFLKDHISGVVKGFKDELRKNSTNAYIVQYSDMCERIHYRFIESILKAIGNVSRCEILIIDDKFQGPVLLCAFELIRHVYKIDTVHFDHIRRHLQVRPIEMWIIIELVLKHEPNFQSSTAKVITRRLIELQERILESEIWKESETFDILQCLLQFEIAEAQKNLDVREVCSRLSCYISKTVEIFDTISGSNKLIPGKHAMQLLFQKIEIMARHRLHCLLAGLQLSGLYDDTWKILESVLRDANARILQNRHLDAFIICSAYAAAALSDKVTSLSALSIAYRDQPQYMDETVESVFLDRNKTVQITEFYNIVFVPFYRQIKKGGYVTAPPPRFVHGMTPTRMQMMTPLTRKLYNPETSLPTTKQKCATSAKIKLPSKLRSVNSQQTIGTIPGVIRTPQLHRSYTSIGGLGIQTNENGIVHTRNSIFNQDHNNNNNVDSGTTHQPSNLDPRSRTDE
ncbi:hypothetical protein HK098_004834 [Nowakowskiella sp. JEL0407]|nr:hypothetical protein HK098_004834 [Nowakowskiella sp. JEL0407]